MTNYPGAKTDLLVLRKIPAGAFKGFTIGGTAPAENNMTWSFGYWIAVFETTQAQREKIGTGSWQKTREFIGDKAYQMHSAGGGQVFVGFRVCMQSTADGKKLIGIE